MYGRSQAATPEEYIDGLDEPRRSDLRSLHDLVRAAAPGLEPTMEFGTLGYGKYHYRYATGREGDSCVVSLASNKNYISLYVQSTTPAGQYLAETFRDRLPKASIGKSCIRFKRLSDVDTAVLSEIVGTAAANPPGPLTSS